MTPRRFVALLACLAALAGAAATRSAEEPTRLGVVASGTGSLRLEGRSGPLPFLETPRGPLFHLQTLVAQLGGDLVVGPLGDSHVLRIGGAEAIFGTDSPTLSVDRELVTLSQPPQPAVGGVHVPLDLVERLWGGTSGYSFVWDRAAQALTVSSQPLRELAVRVELVAQQGLSTVVLEFPQAPRYSIVRGDQRVTVEIAGDRLRGTAPAARGDSLVRKITVGERRIQIDLAPGSTAEEYVLQNPFRIVFDVFRSRATAPVITSPGPSLPRAGYGLRTIVLDPGHGGRDTGAIGGSGLAEKELVLRLAEALQRRLEERLPVRVVLTREEDADLPLDTRTALANQYKADLFVSLHLNSAPGSRAHGAETFFLSLDAGDSSAADLAARENRAGRSAQGSNTSEPPHDLELILWDLAQSHYLSESQRVAKMIQGELNDELGLTDRGVKQAPFRVLRGAAMPAVLVELGFLSNPEEESRLASAEYRSQLVEALVRAITRYRATIAGTPGPGASEAPPDGDAR